MPLSVRHIEVNKVGNPSDEPVTPAGALGKLCSRIGLVIFTERDKLRKFSRCMSRPL
jgi:hypothetical protein